MKKRIVITLLIAAMTMSLCAGCGGKKTETKEEPKVKTEKVKEPELTEADLTDYVTGIDDHYVLQNAENVDYTYGIAYDAAVIKSVTADVETVKEDTPGTYDVTYTITVDTVALEASKKEETADDKKEEPEAAVKEEQKEETKTSDEPAKEDPAKDCVDVTVDKTVEIVDPDKAQDLADKGEVVWGNDNNSVPKTDGTVVKEEVVTPPAAEKDNVKKPEQQTSQKPEASKPAENKPAGNISASTNKPAKPSQPSTPAHQHTWEPVTKTEKKWIEDEPAWDEPIYEYRTICTCGKDITDNLDMHYANGCNGSYSNKKVQTGTKHHDAKGHYESKTVTTGYKCSCGATK